MLRLAPTAFAPILHRAAQEASEVKIIRRLKSSAHVERFEGVPDERFCVPERFDHRVSFEVCQVELPERRDSLGGGLQCDQSFVECAGEDFCFRGDRLGTWELNSLL